MTHQVTILFALCLSLLALGAHGCSNDEDCFLNGECTNGVCHCDYGWGGDTCQNMTFQPAPPVGAYGYAPNVTTWGGVPVQIWNTYHLIVTEIVGGCGLCTWGSNSHIIHATSSNLLGPYKYEDEALPIWSHNPQIITDHSSNPPTYLLFHIGNANGGTTPKQCGNTTTGQRTRSSLASGILHTATNPAGPWTPQNPSGLGGCNNPAPYVFPNGSIMLVCSQDGVNLYTAPSWKGPWKGLSMSVKGDGGLGIWEDPFLWRDKRGIFKLIWHVYPAGGTSAHYWDRVSGYMYSRDGINWVRFPWQPYNNVVQHTSGTVAYTTRERPKIFFAPDGTTPLALFNGVARGSNCWDCKLTCGVDWTFNLAVAFAPA